MTKERPSQVQTHHLQRLAIIYVRQSTLRQVRENHDSTEYQRCLRNLALTWGWQPAQIKVIDADRGRAGIGTTGRNGFRTHAACRPGSRGRHFLRERHAAQSRARRRP